MTTFAQALAHAQRGDFAVAEQILAAIVKRERKNADALHLLANILYAKGDIVGALAHFASAARLAPNDAVLAFNHGAALADGKRHAEAVEAFTRALARHPNDAQALLARGSSFAALGRYGEALASYDAARDAGLDRSDLHVVRGAALAALGRHEEALAACDAAIARGADNVSVHYNRGAVLIALDRAEEAVEALGRALAHDPHHALARAHRATALAHVGRFEEALADIGAAIAREPERLDHLNRQAHILSVAGRRAEAVAVYDRILAQTPDDHEAAFSRADALLALGDFERGLEGYEARLKRPGILHGPPSDAPLWTGAESLEGKTILVQGEQGFGDLFQFSRFIPDLAARGAIVILQERPQTLALMQTLKGLTRVVSTREPAPSADFRISTNSLIRALGVGLDTIPAPIPYLHAEAARVARWRSELGPAQRKRIGVCWSGMMLHAVQRIRTLDEASLERLLAADADIISLQHDPGPQTALLEKHNARNLGPATTDFADLAALIEALDLVITVDTNVAHLAGALGKPVWIMLPFTADWRWLAEREDTPWYPTARLFRQSRFGDWESVVANATAALHD